MLNCREDFKNGKIEKYDYMYEMHKGYKFLYEYSKLIKDTRCLKIEITGKDVIYIFNSLGMEIKMTCLSHDRTSVPFTFLDFGGYDTPETKLLCSKKLIKDDAIIFDVGANLGWYTIHWLKKFPNCKVYPFEPVRETFDKLLDNVVLNGLKPYRVQNLALSNVNGESEFYVDLERVGASSMVNLRDTDKAIIEKCRTQKLDDFFFKVGLNRLDFIKIDVEGAEKLVIDGGINTIKSLKPIIYCELLRKWSAKFGYHPQDVVKLLAEIGYKCFYLDGENELQRIYEIDDQTSQTNFLFIYQ
jgi:FkbM family methyltransferase